MEYLKDFDRWNVHKKEVDAAVKRVDCNPRDLWWCTLGVNIGREQHSQTQDFSRPVLIIKRFTPDIFWAIPLTTKVKNIPFRIKIVLNSIENDVLICHLRSYDRKRLKRKIGKLSEFQFNSVISEIQNLLHKTDPTFVESSEPEGNVYLDNTKHKISVNPILQD